MMATVRHVTSSSGLRKFQTDGFLSDRVYNQYVCLYLNKKLKLQRLLMAGMCYIMLPIMLRIIKYMWQTFIFLNGYLF